MEQYNFYENRAVNAAVQLPKILPGEGYMPSEGLVRALNVALMLQKPLLVTGVPGTGKSDLAYHIAERFGWGEVLPFSTRTDSVYTDLLYRYDSLAHFHKVNIEKGTACELDAKQIEDNYIHYQALGQAIRDSIEKQCRRVVLIDEIDKAPRDLPNDILSIIESMSFEVPELKSAKNTNPSFYEKQGEEAYKPVVILTSNSEKTLPEPFLRRCVYFHIDMPKKPQLMKILLKKGRILPNLDKKSAASFIDLFLEISDLVTGKKPATHELILWIWWMQENGFSADELISFSSSSANAATLLSGMSILAKEESDLKAVVKAIETRKLKG